MSGRILWNPPRDVRERTTLGRYLNWMRDEHGRDLADWDELWRWSVDDLEGFWASLWEFFDVQASEPYDEVLTTHEMPGAKWFTQSRLNYTEHMLGTRDDEDRVAIVARSQTREPMSLTFGELREQVARCRWGLLNLGVGPGDRVVGYLPNVPETVVAFIATASLGATWATCAPEFGSRSVIDRFAQIEPKVLLTVGGYGFRDRYLDRTEEVAKLREALPTVEHVVHVPYGEAVVPDAIEWSELLRYEGPLEFEQVPFDHPLVVLFSSGTTGLPKAIVHGHGNLLVEHFKAHGLQWDVGPGEAPAAVHDDRVDDVERARVGAHPARLDRPHRRRPHLARPQPPVAPRRRDRRDPRGHVARLPHGLPQGRAAAGPRPRSLAAQDGHHRRLAAARRRASRSSTTSSVPRRCSSTAAAAPTCARRS